MNENAALREALVRDLNERTRLRRITSAAVLLATLGLSVAIATPKNTFKVGEKLSADAVNATFSDLDKRVSDATERPTVTRNSKRYSLGATYCGRTDPKAGGALGGYAGAKALCEGTTGCASASSHMCTSEELTRSAQMSILSASGWYSSGTYSTTGGASPLPLRDCLAWGTTSSGSDLGSTWDSNGPSGAAACTSALPVLCCD